MQRLTDSPTGRLVPIRDEQQAFVPNPLPRDLPMSPRLVSLLVDASSAVGTLRGIGETVPNPRLLIRPFIRREAVLSSRIEGTIASLSDVFAYEVEDQSPPGSDVAEVVNYVTALECGIDQLEALPISYRLVNEIHSRLLDGVRGQDTLPGQFRDVQVWIGAPRSTIHDARFVPPPPNRLRDLFYDWEKFANESTQMPPLVRCALMHYQLEAIHPYPDGNGRIGRLLITLFLCASGVLPIPLLYMSAYFERDRRKYYDELFAVSETGDWEPWLTYFLIGVHEEARDTMERIRRIRRIQDEWRALLQSRNATAKDIQMMDELFSHPLTTVSRASKLLGMSDAGARGVLDRLIDDGILTRTRRSWPRQYIARRLLYEIERPIASQDY